MDLRKHKKYIGAAAAIVILGVLIYNVATRDGAGDADYIFDKYHDIRLGDIKKYLQRVEFTDELVKEYFSKKIANPYTIQFFNSLQKKFQSNDFEEHFESVRQYLYSVMERHDADQLLFLYRKYVNYQKDLNKKISEWGMPGTSEEALRYLGKLQDYRRDYFGAQTADVLFGADIKAKEYPIRRSIIVHDKNLYGEDKLAQINKLNADMWGDEAGNVERYEKPYTRYKERFFIFQKDMEEMTETQKIDKVAEFRKEIFSTDVLEKLNEVDEFLSGEKVKESQYRLAEQKILKNTDLNDAEKKDRLKELQESIFGEDADAFLRRENIKKAAEKR